MKHGAYTIAVLVTALILCLPGALAAEPEKAGKPAEASAKPAESTKDSSAAENPPEKKDAAKSPDPEFVGQNGKIKWNNSTSPSLSSTPGAKDSGGGSMALDIFIWLGVLILVIVGGLWAFKKFFPASKHMFGSKLMRILGRSHLSPKHTVYLLKVADRVLVVGVSGERINQLTEISDPREVAFLTSEGARESAESRGGNFMSMFRQKRTDFQEPVEPAQDDITEARDEVDRIKNMVSSWNEHYSDAENG